MSEPCKFQGKPKEEFGGTGLLQKLKWGKENGF